MSKHSWEAISTIGIVVALISGCIYAKETDIRQENIKREFELKKLSDSAKTKQAFELALNDYYKKTNSYFPFQPIDTSAGPRIVVDPNFWELYDSIVIK